MSIDTKISSFQSKMDMSTSLQSSSNSEYLFEGVNCIKETPTLLFKKLLKESQSRVPWVSNRKYAFYVIYFGVVLSALTTLWHWGWRVIDFKRRNINLDNKGSRRIWKFPLKFVAFFRMISYYKLPPILTTIAGLPLSTGMSLILFSMILFTLLYTFLPDPSYYYRGCQNFGSPPISLRTGLMTLGIFPFLLMISGKTNLISFFTGVSYERLNVIHQLLGWLSFFLALVHTVPLLIQPTKEGGLERLRWKFANHPLYLNGLPPLIILFLICLFSLRWFRTRYYEIFVNVHWVLGMAYTATLTWHVFKKMASDKFIWPSLAFWVIQLVYRGFFKTFLKPNSYAFKTKKAVVTLLPNDLFEINIDINYRNREFQWVAGQHLFIRFVFGLNTLDNHPFSILTLPKLNSTRSQLKLLVKPHKGLTKKIQNLLLNQEDNTLNLDCYIDGPYGGISRDILSFNTLVLISCGSGITAVFPYLCEAVENFRNNSSCLKKVNFTWVIRDLSSLDWIRDQLEETLSKLGEVDDLKSFVEINIYVTNSKSYPNQAKIINPINDFEMKEYISTKKGTESEKTFDLLSQNFNFHVDQKPNFLNYVDSIELNYPRTCFIVSGRKSIQRDVGIAVSKLQKRIFWSSTGNGVQNNNIEEVYLHTENFGW